MATTDSDSLKIEMPMASFKIGKVAVLNHSPTLINSILLMLRKRVENFSLLPSRSRRIQNICH